VLTGLQERFVQEYLVDLNATQAAIRAGYSRKAAQQHGSRVKRRPHVRERIEAAMAERAERTGIRQDRVIAELARLAFSDIRDVADWDGEGVRVKDSQGMGPKQSACIAEIAETPTKEGRKLRVKLHGKTRALEMLARHLGLFAKEPPQGGDTVFQVVTRVPEPDWEGDDPVGPDGPGAAKAAETTETAGAEAPGAPERVREDAP